MISPSGKALHSQKVIDAFSAYMDHGGHRITRALFERNLALKMDDPQFTADIGPLLAAGDNAWNMGTAAEAVGQSLLSRLPGAPWDRETR